MAAPPLQPEKGNPYLPALVGPGYWPNQRVVLLAAGLTYETIPPSPWATSVKAVLEGLFQEHPYGSSADRVREHYRAYHAAHGRIGCRRCGNHRTAHIVRHRQPEPVAQRRTNKIDFAPAARTERIVRGKLLAANEAERRHDEICERSRCAAQGTKALFLLGAVLKHVPPEAYTHW